MQQASMLVVENDAAVRELLAAVLGEHYAVTLADCATGGIEALRKELPDLLIADCIVPGGGLNQLLAKAEATGVPVLLTSGRPDQITRHERRHAFLAKPYKLQDLLDIVGDILAMRRMGIRRRL